MQKNASVFRQVEAVIGVFFAVFVGLVFIVTGSMIFSGRGDGRHWAYPVHWLSGSTIIACEGLFLFTLKQEFGNAGGFFAPGFAVGSKNWPAYVVRPLAAIWWIVHFLSAILLSYFLQKLLFDKPDDLAALVKQCSVSGFLTFTGAYSANLYALLAMAAIGTSDGMIYRVWRWRFVIDLGIAIAASTVPFLGR